MQSGEMDIFFTDKLVLGFLSSSLYALPVLRIEMPYHRRKSRGGRILVELQGGTHTVEEAATLLFESRGFTVFPGDEVDAFIFLFLIGNWGSDGNLPFGDVFLNWVTINGYPKKESARLRAHQRALVRMYLEGHDSVWEKCLTVLLNLRPDTTCPRECYRLPILCL